MRIAILRETKNPPDRRVPFTPLQCRELMNHYPGLVITIQPDKNRCFSDKEYQLKGIGIKEDLSESEILTGVKEVKSDCLIPGKSYIFFSHTAKKQKHNLELLRTVIRKKIRLIDYEYLTDKNKVRIVAFGRWAGFVGAYNALRAYGLRNGKYILKPAWQCKDSSELLVHLSEIKNPDQRIVITGGGRVAAGAMEILDKVGFKKVTSETFLGKREQSAYTQLDPDYYVKRKDNSGFNLQHFYLNPHEYENNFLPYTRVSDIFIACHFWDPRSPELMTKEDMRNPEFQIKIIADVSCDVGGPIPSTLRASTIADPFYGYDRNTGEESDPFDPQNIMVMSVDNLPGELPRDSSEDFGSKLASVVIPSLLGISDQDVIERATIANNGKLTPDFAFLQDFLDGKE